MKHQPQAKVKTIPLFLAGDHIAYVSAGPTRDLPETHDLIRCAREIPVDPERVAYDVATADFQPFDDAVIYDMLPQIMTGLYHGERLYVGCMGGTGRTGTMLAIIAAQHPDMTGDDAIAYIRAIYKPHAVETEEQMEQVRRLAGIWTPTAAPIYDGGFDPKVLEAMTAKPAPDERGMFRRIWDAIWAG